MKMKNDSRILRLLILEGNVQQPMTTQLSRVLTGDLIRPLRVCCDIWHQDVSSRSFKDGGFEVWPPWSWAGCCKQDELFTRDGHQKSLFSNSSPLPSADTRRTMIVHLHTIWRLGKNVQLCFSPVPFDYLLKDEEMLESCSSSLLEIINI